DKRTIALSVFFFQAEDGIRAFHVTGVQTCALPIFHSVGCIPCVLRSYFLLMIFLEEIFRMAVQAGKAGCDSSPRPVPGRTRALRSEERRVGKEGGSRGMRGQWKWVRRRTRVELSMG